jgi:hypothetical protein
MWEWRLPGTNGQVPSGAPNADAFLPSGDDHLAAHLGSGFRRGRGIGVGRRKMKALDG